MKTIPAVLFLVACGGDPDAAPETPRARHGFLFSTTGCVGDVLVPPRFVSPGTGEASWIIGSDLTSPVGACTPNLVARAGGLDVLAAPCGAGRVEGGRLQPTADGGFSVSIETSARSSTSECSNTAWGDLR